MAMARPSAWWRMKSVAGQRSEQNPQQACWLVLALGERCAQVGVFEDVPSAVVTGALEGARDPGGLGWGSGTLGG